MKKDLLERFACYLEAQSTLIQGVPNPWFPSVTISRRMGSGGIEIAQLLLEWLTNSSTHTWMVFDKNLAELVWRNQNLPDAVRRFMGEEVPQPIQDTVQELLGVRTLNWRLVELTVATILRLTRLGNAIFVGRGSNVITANQKSVFHVRLVAPFANRVRQIEAHHRLGPQEAVDLISTTDDARRRYVKHYFRAEIEDPINYHMVINTGLTGYEEAARIIGDAALKLRPEGH
jgi:Cytidylate kinase-like family